MARPEAEHRADRRATRRAPRRPGRRAPAIVAVGSGVVVASLLIGGAVLAQGYDAKDVPTIESAVWVSRDAGGGQFAKVNTDIGEIESVNDAAGLAGIAQAGSEAFVLGSGYSRLWPIDAAAPVDVVEGQNAGDAPTAGRGDAPTAGEGLAAPEGTTGTVSAGDHVLFTGPRLAYADAGELAAAPDGSDDAGGAIHELVPPVADGAPAYVAAAWSISAAGRVAIYSVQDSERRVRTYDIRAGVWDEIELAQPPTSPAGLQLAFSGDRLVMLQADADQPRIWVDGAGPYALPEGLGADALLQGSGPASDVALIAASDGLHRVALADGAEVEHVEAAGIAARPVAFGERWAAAWLASGSGQLWVSGAAEPVALDIDGGEFDDNVEIAPALVTNGDRAVLLERTTGMLWSVPDGTLVPLAQWSADDEDTPLADEDVPDTSPAPPVAVDDRFGVRAGAIAVLPVLYNDHDPNQEDVLSIDPESVTGLDPAFGTLSLVGANQTLVVEVTGASPSATFSYRATDGKNSSAVAATVTLSLTSERSAPQWCEDYLAPDACFVQWPRPQILIGGTATFDVLKGWIDPEGDAVVIDSAVPEAGAPIVAMPADDGTLAIGHTDRSGAPGAYSVMVSVRDASGDVSAPKELTVEVLAAPDFSVKGGVVLGRAGEWTTVAADEFASGGSGSYQVLDVTELTVGGRLEKSWNEAAGTMRFRAAEPGEYIVTAKVKDAATPSQHDVSLRVTVLPEEQHGVAIPPLTAYVRQGEDALVDVLGAVQNTTGDVLLVTGATPGPAPGGGPAVVAASVVDHAVVQLRSIDSLVAEQLGRSDGPLGTVAVTLADAAGTEYRGAIAVFLVAASGQAPLAVPDAVTVRAGDVAEIAVLDNDVAPRGERLALHPDVSTAGEDEGLAFSAGRTLRYLAPEVPGTYTVFYYAYLESSPELLSRSQVTVTVLPPGANRAPQAIDLESRTLAGRTVSIPVPVDTMDPDGDRVQVTSVTQPAEARLGAVMVGDGGRSLRFTAPEANRQEIGGTQAGGWQAEFTYTVKDAQGQTATGTARVAVSAADPEDLAPITFIDTVRVKQVAPGGEPVSIVVEPLRNDRDPAQGSATVGSQSRAGLHLLYEVVPNMVGMSGGRVAPGSPYERAQALQVAPQPELLEDGTTEFYPDGAVEFEVTEDTEPGTYTFLYTVESLKTRSTAEGVIAITVSAGDAPNQPVIGDTVVTASTRAQVESGGIDVLQDVVWPTGDASALEVAELGPGAPAGFAVDGRRIEGRIPADGATIAFKVAYGQNAAGEPSYAWGLLRIPAFDDYRLQVVRSADPITELESGDIDLKRVLDVAADDTVEVDPGSSFTTHRPSTNENLAITACALKSGGGSVLTYRAGYSPGIGSDTCTVDVRLAGQSDDAWSTVVVPIPIKPKDPLAILTPVTKTVNIVNGRITVDLHDELVSWTGGFSMDDAGRRDTMTFTASYGGSSFKVTPVGSPSDLALEIDVSPSAPSGARETVSIHLDYPWPSDPSLPHFQKDVALVLYVGSVPAQGPSGATLTKACDAKAAEQCRLDVVFPSDQSGQFNPLSGNTSGESTALRLVGVGGGSTAFECAGLGQAVAQGSGIALTLLPAAESKPAGGTCTVPFTVADVRGRTGTGQVAFDVTGFPQAPDAPLTAASRRGEVDIDVVLGAARSAHPPVDAVRLFEGGALVAGSTCARLDTGTFRCTVTGLQNAVPHTYTARTVNTQGDESAMSGPLTTWAFVAPRFPGGGEPTYEDRVYSAATDAGHGVVRIRSVCLEDNSAVAGQASSVRFQISLPGNAAVVLPVSGSPACTTQQDVRVTGTGPYTITATPVSGAQPPPIGTSTATNESGGTVSPVLVSHGSPGTGPAFAVTWDGTASVATTFSPQWNAGDTGAPPPVGTFPQIQFLAWPAADPAPVCTASVNGGGFTELSVSGPPSLVVKTGTTSAAFAVPGDLVVNERYSFKACGTYGYGIAESTPSPSSTQWLFKRPAAPSASPMTFSPASEDMNDPAIRSVADPTSAPVFTWDLTGVTDAPTAAPDFTASMPSEAPPAGSTWELRYASGSSPTGALPAGSPSAIRSLAQGNQFVNWYAQWCFTAGGDDFCSLSSAAITPTSQYTGVPFGESRRIVLVPSSTCIDQRGAWNAAIVAAGDAAVEQARVAIAENARENGFGLSYPGRAATYQALYVDSGFEAHFGNDYVTGEDTSGWTGQLAELVDWYLNPHTVGSATHPGFTQLVGDYLAANPGSTQTQAEDASRVPALQGAQVRANQIADQAGADAYAAAYADPATIASAQSARPGGEQTQYDAMKSTIVGPAAISSTTFASSPLSGPPGAVAADDATRRFGAIVYDFTTASPSPAFNSAYIKAALVAQYPSGYTCG